MTETQTSPIESIKKGVKRRVEGIRVDARKAFAVSGMTAKTRLPTEDFSQKQAEIRELSSAARTLGEDADSTQERELFQQRLGEATAELAIIRQSQQDTNGKSLNSERTLDERFERGEMFRIIKRILKKRSKAATDEEKDTWNKRYHVGVEISRDLTSKLDRLNRQYYSPEYMQLVDVEALGEKIEIPVRRYSLRESDKAQPDDQVSHPIVIIGGFTSGPTVTKSTAEAFALQYPNRDVYVIGYPDSTQSKISPDFPDKLKKHGDLATYAQINKDVLLKMGFENFDLVGISMGGGIALQAATDTEFAKKINNLIAISPAIIQETKGILNLGLALLREMLYSRMHPKQWLRVPQVQPGYKLGSHKGMGVLTSGEIARHKTISADQLAGIHIQGRMIIGTGDEDVLISGEQVARETAAANAKRTISGERPIEFTQFQGGHHSLGDAYAAGIVALIRNTSELPSQVMVSKLPRATAEVFVQEDPRLAPIANQIL